jgi:flagella basal body P-ring formation protein FlgA
MKWMSKILLPLVLLASTAYGQYFQPIVSTDAAQADAIQADSNHTGTPQANTAAQTTKFVPDPGRLINAAVELRSDATIYGEDISFKQIARWSDADAAAVAPLADLVLDHLSEKVAFKTITIDQIKAVLRDAGFNEAMIRFTGATACTVKRGDIQFDEGEALSRWMDAKKAQSAAEDVVPATQPAVVLPIGSPMPAGLSQAAAMNSILSSKSNFAPRSLRALLLSDLATRLKLSPESLQVTFNPADDKLLNLAEPQFRFNIEPRRVRDLGDVSWTVTILTDAGKHKSTISATARAWQEQVVITHPVAMKQVLRAEDITIRRVLLDQMMDDLPLSAKQTIGQQAARDLRTGSVMTAKLVDPVPMVKSGQLVTVTLGQGQVQVKTVARAMETGVYGESIKVKNETTKAFYDVTVTGPQTAVVGELPETTVAVATN